MAASKRLTNKTVAHPAASPPPSPPGEKEKLRYRRIAFSPQRGENMAA